MKKTSDTKKEVKTAGGRVLEGVVLRISGDKTVAVEVTHVTRHELYGKKLVRSKRFLVHDADNSAKVGETVKIRESRPHSKRKRWSLVGEDVKEKAGKK